MRIVLRSSGAEVMSAASAEEAFEQVEQWHPDILVSDMGLPDVDGYALIQKLRTDRKSTRLNSSHITISYAVFCLKKKIYDNMAFPLQMAHMKKSEIDKP